MSLPTDFLASAAVAPYVFVGRASRARSDAARTGNAQPQVRMRVDEAIIVPDLVGDLVGRTVTVIAADKDIRPGARYLVAATGVHVGDELVLSELASCQPPRREPVPLADLVIDARLRALDDALTDRLSAAVAVVYGFLDDVHDVGSMPPARASDRLPTEVRVRWQVARVVVWRFLAGNADDPRLLFPTLRTQRWSETPLYAEGQEGIWLLHDPRRPGAVPSAHKWPRAPGALVAASSADYHAAAELERIRLLLRRGTGSSAAKAT